MRKSLLFAVASLAVFAAQTSTAGGVAPVTPQMLTSNETPWVGAPLVVDIRVDAGKAASFEKFVLLADGRVHHKPTDGRVGEVMWNKDEQKAFLEWMKAQGIVTQRYVVIRADAPMATNFHEKISQMGVEAKAAANPVKGDLAERSAAAAPSRYLVLHIEEGGRSVIARNADRQRLWTYKSLLKPVQWLSLDRNQGNILLMPTKWVLDHATGTVLDRVR